MGAIPPDSDVVYEWRGEVDNAAVNCLHAEGFEHPLLDIDWRTQLGSHSLGRACARRYGELVGFVNVAWDGGVHAFVLDTIVAPRPAGLASAPSWWPEQHEGLGRRDVSGFTSIARATCEASTSTHVGSRQPTPGSSSSDPGRPPGFNARMGYRSGMVFRCNARPCRRASSRVDGRRRRAALGPFGPRRSLTGVPFGFATWDERHHRRDAEVWVRLAGGGDLAALAELGEAHSGVPGVSFEGGSGVLCRLRFRSHTRRDHASGR